MAENKPSKRPVGELHDDFVEWGAVASRDVSQPGKGLLLEFFRMSGLDDAGQRWRYYRRAETDLHGFGTFSEPYGFAEIKNTEPEYPALDPLWVIQVKRLLSAHQLQELNDYVTAKTHTQEDI